MKKALLVISLLLTVSSVYSQTALEEQLRHAESLFDSGKFFDAVTEYKRAEFFDAGKRYAYKTNFMIGLCYKAGLKYDDAVYYIGKALSASRNEEEKFLASIELIKLNILKRNLPAAYAKIGSLKKKYKDLLRMEELNYWLGWAYMFDGKWEAARKIFKSSGREELAVLCKKVADEEYDVTFAKLISYIVPGAGQIYTENYLSGAMSFGWHLLWGYLTVNAFAAERIFDGFVIGNMLWFRFYRGNFQNAEKFAVEKNVEIYNNAYDYLLKNYRGKKP